MSMNDPQFVLTPVEPRARRDARGQLLLPRELKARAKQYASRKGISFNDLVVRLLEHAVDSDGGARAA